MVYNTDKNQGRTAKRPTRSGQTSLAPGVLIIGSPEHSTKEGRKAEHDRTAEKSKEDSNTIFNRPRKGAPDMDL